MPRPWQRLVRLMGQYNMNLDPVPVAVLQPGRLVCLHTEEAALSGRLRQCGSRTSAGTGAPVASVCAQDIRSLDPALIRAGWGWGRPRLVLPQGADELSLVVRPLQACTEADCWVKLAPLFVKTDRAYPGIFLVRHSPRITVQLRVISSSRCSCLWHDSVFTVSLALLLVCV